MEVLPSILLGKVLSLLGRAIGLHPHLSSPSFFEVCNQNLTSIRQLMTETRRPAMLNSPQGDVNHAPGLVSLQPADQYLASDVPHPAFVIDQVEVIDPAFVGAAVVLAAIVNAAVVNLSSSSSSSSSGLSALDSSFGRDRAPRTRALFPPNEVGSALHLSVLL